MQSFQAPVEVSFDFMSKLTVDLRLLMKSLQFLFRKGVCRKVSYYKILKVAKHTVCGRRVLTQVQEFLGRKGCRNPRSTLKLTSYSGTSRRHALYHTHANIVVYLSGAFAYGWDHLNGRGALCTGQNVNGTRNDDSAVSAYIANDGQPLACPIICLIKISSVQ